MAACSCGMAEDVLCICVPNRTRKTFVGCDTAFSDVHTTKATRERLRTSSDLFRLLLLLLFLLIVGAFVLFFVHTIFRFLFFLHFFSYIYKWCRRYRGVG